MAAAFLPIAFYVADSTPLRILLVATAGSFALGLFDDLRPIRPAAKFAAQISMAALFLWFAPATDLTGEPAVDVLLSFLWFVGITNAFNLLDNIDGLASGIAAIAGGFFLIALLLNGSAPLAVLAVAVAALTGAALGFLVYNWHPASIFMGDSGSHLLGSFLAGAALLAVPHMHEGSQAGIAIAVIILLVPCADTTLVVITRQLAGRSAFEGGRDHLSHRIVALGMRERPAVLVLYGIAIAGGVVALGLQNLPPATGWTLALAYGIAVGGVGVYLGRIPIARPTGLAKPVSPAPDFNWQYPGYELLFDMALVTLAYFVGLVTRFPEAERFSIFLDHFLRILPLVVVLHLAALWAVGRYRRAAHTNALNETLVILQGSALGSAAAVIAVLYVTGFQGYSRQAFAVAAVLVVLFLSGGHLLLRALADWFEQRRTQGRRAIVYGAGHRGALAIRELKTNPKLALSPHGIIDDDPGRANDRIDGLRVLGTISDLDRLLTETDGRVTTVIVTARALQPETFDLLCDTCERHQVEVRQLRFSLDEVDLDRRERTSGIVRFPRS